MVAKVEADREVKQWGVIFNMMKERKTLSELPLHSHESKVIMRILGLMESRIKEVKLK